MAAITPAITDTTDPLFITAPTTTHITMEATNITAITIGITPMAMATMEATAIPEGMAAVMPEVTAITAMPEGMAEAGDIPEVTATAAVMVMVITVDAKKADRSRGRATMRARQHSSFASG